MDADATGVVRLAWDGCLVAVVLMVVALAAGCAGSAGHLAFEYRLDVLDTDCNGTFSEKKQTHAEPL